MKAIVLIAVSLMLSDFASARPLTIEGSARMEDGQPLREQTVVFTQVHGFLMGKAKKHGQVKTDAAGNFKLTFPDVKGTIDIDLKPMRCAHNGDTRFIDLKRVDESQQIVKVEMIAKPNDCRE